MEDLNGKVNLFMMPWKHGKENILKMLLWIFLSINKDLNVALRILKANDNDL